ncbi:MAG: hypothetical protein R3A52_30445 [Polyangiales bacterium]
MYASKEGYDRATVDQYYDAFDSPERRAVRVARARSRRRRPLGAQPRLRR